LEQDLGEKFKNKKDSKFQKTLLDFPLEKLKMVDFRKIKNSEFSMLERMREPSSTF
jgi:hypothetical protein